MRLSRLLRDDEAVSPVIGVILMVAITVILAAVIGTFVLGIGENQQKSPQASFDWVSGTNQVTVTHAGGDTFENENTARLRIIGDPLDEADSTPEQADWAIPVSAGEQRSVALDGSDASGEVRIRWKANSGKNTQIIATYEVS